MIGMNAQTGRAISGLAHIYQSIGQILTTALASRVERREFGSELPDLIDAPYNTATRVRLYAATATALMRFEPRIKVTRVRLADTDGAPHAPVLDIEGVTKDTGDTISTSVQLTPGGAA